MVDDKNPLGTLQNMLGGVAAATPYSQLMTTAKNMVVLSSMESPKSGSRGKGVHISPLSQKSGPQEFDLRELEIN